MDDILEHYGMPRRSGRYPYGSGKNPYQRTEDFFNTVRELKKKGLSEVEIASHLGMNTKQYRNEVTLQNKIRKELILDTVNSMKKHGHSETEIAKKTGLSYNTVVKYLNNQDKIKKSDYNQTKDFLIEDIKKHKYIDVGVGSESQLGISKTKLDAIVKDMANNDGYYLHKLYVRRTNDRNKFITVKVLTDEPDINKVIKDSHLVRTPEKWIDKTDTTRLGLTNKIQSIDSKRIQIRYKEDGGEDKDGIIEIRRGLKDLDLGNSKYLQARIMVDNQLYLKGMVMYSDNIPKGKDIIFNTNKGKDTPFNKVLKTLEGSEDNPFKSTIKYSRGALNIVNEEGDWLKWKGTLSSQFLSKQPVKLIQERADATYKKIQDEYSEILKVKNPVVRQYLLNTFNEDIKTKASQLKLLGLPNTRAHVLLPFPEMKSNEVYAPNYKNGEKVVLVRHPHAGRFEIPELIVNNKTASIKKIIGNPTDAIGIHPTVAKKLSGADFDGDSVLVIPNNHGKIKSQDMLKGLKDFDPHSKYKIPEGSKVKVIKDATLQKEMGIVSNLITDMTLKGASTLEIERAVKHSMVVIDAKKHKLDYRKSAIDNGIESLKTKYQLHIDENGKEKGGASTLISRSKQPERDIENKRTGNRLMDVLDDASKISSGTPVEKVYVNYINKIKVMSNEINKEIPFIEMPNKNRISAKIYEDEVNSLNLKLQEAMKNAPRERQAQLMAKQTIRENYSPDITKDQYKKLKTQAINSSRNKVGAKLKEDMIQITENEWDAINADAVSSNTLKQILRYTKDSDIKRLATPRENNKLSDTVITRVKTLVDNGYTVADIAGSIGVSTSTIHKLLKGED